jgi:hypothetical protein
MSVTTTATQTIKEVLNQAAPGQLPDALRKVQLGTMLTPIKLVKTGLSSAASFDITSAALGSNPAALGIFTLRVTAGTAAAGVRMIGDAGATPSATVATLSDNGKTITFEDVATAFVMEYLPRPAADTTGAFANS